MRVNVSNASFDYYLCRLVYLLEYELYCKNLTRGSPFVNYKFITTFVFCLLSLFMFVQAFIRSFIWIAIILQEQL